MTIDLEHVRAVAPEALIGLEHRAVDADKLRELLGGGYTTAAGKTVSDELALTLSATWAAIKFLAEQVAQLPLVLYRESSSGAKERARDHPLYAILHDLFNARTTSDEGRRFLLFDYLSRGNGVCYVRRNNAGAVIDLWPLAWKHLELRVVPDPSGGMDANLVYTWKPSAGRALFAFPSAEAWHIRHLSSDGYQGLSPLQRMRETLGAGVAMQEYASRFFGSGARPGGVLRHPSSLSDEAYRKIRADWERLHQSSEQSHRVAILEEGMEWDSIGFSPEDSQFLESRKFGVTEIARWFGVPSHFLNDLEKATFSNIEFQSINFVVFHLMPLLRNIEQTITRDLLTPAERADGLKARFRVQGLLRGDSTARGAFYTQGINAGWLTRNEAREAEEYNPIDGLDEPLAPLNMAPSSELGAGGDGSGGPSPEPSGGEGDGDGAASKFEADAITASEALNGAQVAAIVELVKSVNADELGAGSAAEIMQVAFGLDAATAGRILERAGAAPVERRAAGKQLELAAAWEGVYAEAVARILRAEQRKVTRKLSALGVSPPPGLFDSWLERYYQADGEFSSFARKAYRAPVEGLSRAAFAAGLAEELGEVTDHGLEEFLDHTVAHVAAHHAIRSRGKIRGTLKANPTTPPAESVGSLFDDWLEVRPIDAARRHTVQQSRAAQLEAYRRQGVKLIKWRTVGENCPWCQRLSGKVIDIETDFVREGEVWEGEAGATFEPSHRIGNPPLHRGCNCTVEAVTEGGE